MMEQLRRSTKWIMILVALAFGGLMFFEWGMDITGQTSGSFGEIGRVNGTPVGYDQYMASYRNLYDRQQQLQEEPVTNAQNSELEDQAWDEVVNGILIRQELERRRIMVTDEEVRSAALLSPPPDLMANPAFQTDGAFDVTKYQQFIATADNVTQLQLEAYYRDVIPRGKLMRQLSSGIHPTGAELWRAWRDTNERAAASYVLFEAQTRIADDRIEISEDEIEDYYDENREEFLVPASAELIYVTLAKAPTAADTTAVVERAQSLRGEIQEGADFAELAERESSDEGTAPLGGDLGVFGRGQMVEAFDSAVFAAPQGTVTEPVRTRFGMHLIEVTERWGQDSAQARHILLPFERTDESEIDLLALADSLEELGEAMALADAAAILELETDTTEIIATLMMVPGAGPIAEGGEWVFEEETSVGDVSPVFESSTAFYTVEVVSIDPERYLTVEEAEPSIRATIGVRKKTVLAVEEAREFAAEVRSGRTLADVAGEFGLDVREAESFTRDDFVPGLGRQNAAVGTAFGLEIGEVSDGIEANGNAYVIERTSFEAADSMAWLEQLDGQRMQLAGLVRQERLALWIEALRANARIVDRREEVLSAPDDSQGMALPPVF